VNSKVKKIGYALGGGAARGMFHIGVLGVLEEHGITPDIIAGTSIGSIIGALYASGLSTKELKQIACSISWRQVMHLTDIVALPKSGLIQGRRIVALLKSILGEISFPQLKYRYAAVAADLYTGQQVVFTEGSLIEAIRASISIPGIFTPVHHKGRYLVDGGLVNVVPVSVCRDLGADFVIGVNVIPDPSIGVMPVAISSTAGNARDRGSSSSIDDDLLKPIVPDSHVQFRGSLVSAIDKGIRKFLLYKQPELQRFIARKPSGIFSIRPKLIDIGDPGVFEVLSQSLSVIEHRVAMENLTGADVAITPLDKTVGYWEFHRAAEAIEAGEKAARLLLQRDATTRMQLALLRS
jgi:NTE family protein